jgi:uronate dehydrogenase
MGRRRIFIVTDSKTVLITGAAGNLGGKLRRHLEGRYPLRLLDIKTRGDEAIAEADLGVWDPAWVKLFAGVDTVVHLAADPKADQTWEQVIGPNIDGVVHVFAAAAQNGVKRVIFASSNHAMGGYKDEATPHKLTTDIRPLPGTHYVVNGEARNSIAYGSAKLMGERIGKCYADIHDLSCIAVRIGWVRHGENTADDMPTGREWFRLMWLSNRDFCQLMERCIEADPSIKFAVVNGMSNNTGMRWDIEYARQVVGYEPQDDVTRAGGGR